MVACQRLLLDNTGMKSREIPAELMNFEYPPALFQETTGQITESTSGVLTLEEHLLRMAKFALLRAAKLPFNEARMLTIAKGEVEQVKEFYPQIRKVWSSSYGNGTGLCQGELELIADELEVYELLFPFDEELLQREAELYEEELALENLRTAA